jgi:hypothetical protein
VGISPKVGLSSARHDEMAMARTRRRLKERGSAHRRRSPQGDVPSKPQRTAGPAARWAKRFPDRRWAVEEGAGGIGRPLAQKLLAPCRGRDGGRRPAQALSSSRVRVLLSRAATLARERPPPGCHLLIALAALRNDRLWPRLNPRTVRRATTLEVLRLLTERREELVAERTRSLNRVCMCSTAGPPL